MDWKTINDTLLRSRKKYSYYDGTYDYADFSKPTAFTRNLPKQRVGWAKRAVDIRANKTQFDRFENDTLRLTDLMKKYHVDEAFNKLKNDILVCGCGFLAVAGDRVFPFTAEEATGTFSWREQNLERGVAVFRRSSERLRIDDRIPDSFIEYLPNATVIHEKGKDVVSEVNVTRRPLIGVLTYNSTAKQPFGRTVITTPARSAIDDASRAVRQAMISAHYYNSKVDVLLGVDNESAVERIEGRTGDVLKVGPNSNGTIPQIGEFAQHAMSPFTDTIRTAAQNFCADTKLSLTNLTLSTEAPQSTEALEIINDDLQDDIFEWHKELGQQLKYFMVTIFMFENGVQRIDENLQTQIDNTIPVFSPVFKADLSKFGDGLIKIAEKAPAITQAKSVWRALGLSSEEIDAIIASAA